MQKYVLFFKRITYFKISREFLNVTQQFHLRVILYHHRIPIYYFFKNSEVSFQNKAHPKMCTFFVLFVILNSKCSIT